MLPHGFLRVAAASPVVRVADCAFNAEQHVNLLWRAEAEAVDLLVFPELSLTGYTCGDLFAFGDLQRGALAALEMVRKATESDFTGIAVVGLPLVVDDQLFNCAAVVHGGQLHGIVPKSFLPNYKEFYEQRWFAPGIGQGRDIELLDETVHFGVDLIFKAYDVDTLTIGIEICEDLWVPSPPSTAHALAGATVLVNLSASNEVIGKAAYRRQLVVNQSGRCIAAYIYACCGVHESTTDVVFGGHCLIAENGTLLAESKRFQREETLLIADVDLQRLQIDRLRMNSFKSVPPSLRQREFGAEDFRLTAHRREPHGLYRVVDAHPFIPKGQEQLRERCEEIFHTQVAGLAKRLEHIGNTSVAIGISGGLDSTLALLVTCKTLDLLGMRRTGILAYTMPGFGTSARTKDNARSLMANLGATARVVDIRAMCMEEWRALGHKPFGLDLAAMTVDEFTEALRKLRPEQIKEDLVFENVQARLRTNILMNSGFVVGTGDISELALGWCTYNADHMSMYNPNISIPKTLVKFLVDWAARNEFAGEAQRVLLDIVGTVISPELLPTGADGAIQDTESAIGPYELHDFFLFHFLRYGTPPEKILFLAKQASFGRAYKSSELRRWLQVFIRRFFASQYKRSCLPDGPKVGSISLSPRGDWRMPSDAQPALWLRWVEGERSED